MGTESHQAGEGAQQHCSWARILHPGTPQERAARGQAGPRPLLTKQLHSPLQSCCGNGRKSLLENPGWEMKPHPGTPLSVNPQHPQADASKALPFSIAFLRSQMIVPLRGALALPPPCFVASFSVHCIFSAASIFIDFSRWAKQRVLHLWGASFAGATGLPAIPHGTGGRIRGQKNARRL